MFADIAPPVQAAIVAGVVALILGVPGVIATVRRGKDAGGEAGGEAGKAAADAQHDLLMERLLEATEKAGRAESKADQALAGEAKCRTEYQALRELFDERFVGKSKQ